MEVVCIRLAQVGLEQVRVEEHLVAVRDSRTHLPIHVNVPAMASCPRMKAWGPCRHLVLILRTRVSLAAGPLASRPGASQKHSPMPSSSEALRWCPRRSTSEGRLLGDKEVPASNFSDRGTDTGGFGGRGVFAPWGQVPPPPPAAPQVEDRA